MKAVENAVSALDDTESFAAYLDELGRRHKSRALKPTYLDVSGSYYLTIFSFCFFQNSIVLLFIQHISPFLTGSNFPANWMTFAIFFKVMLIVQDIAIKRDADRESLF